jgi:hypothetical protein
MKKLFLLPLVLFAGLFVAEAFMMAIPVKAADCTAHCANGGSVSCSGYRCTGRDNVGCQAWDSGGHSLIQMDCTQ